MKLLFRIALSASLALIVSSTFAVEPEPPAEPVEIPTPEYVRLMMARDGAVQRELKLSPAQSGQLKAAVIEVDQPFWRLRDVPPAESAPELQALDAKLRQRLEVALSPEQSLRFEQLVMQARGAKALTAPDLRQQLTLTEAQSRSISGLIATADGGTLSAQKVFEVLKPEQQSRLAELFGPRFDLGQISRIGCMAPEMRSVECWINTSPLTLESQRGKVVAVHFWAFGCINCIRNLPHYQAWHEKFPDKDLTIIGIHTPETAAERDLDKLRANIIERGIKYPVAFDLTGENWKAWANNLWPSVYLIDRQGQVRSWWYGELNWQGATGEAQMRERIAALIAER